ncbi:hypothetical protein Aduo_002697 [Ancylostoma duodenale]
MSSVYFLFAFLLVLGQRSLASFPIGGLEGAAVPVVQAPIAAPVVHAHGHAPLPPPIAFQNGPIFTSLTPSIHPVHHTPTVEVRNIIRTAHKEAGHFSGTMQRSSGIPIKA